MPSYANPKGEEYKLAKHQSLFLCSGQNILQRSISGGNDKVGKEQQDEERKGDEEDDKNNEDDEDGARFREAITSYFVQLCQHDYQRDPKGEKLLKAVEMMMLR